MIQNLCLRETCVKRKIEGLSFLLRVRKDKSHFSYHSLFSWYCTWGKVIPKLTAPSDCLHSYSNSRLILRMDVIICTKKYKCDYHSNIYVNCLKLDWKMKASDYELIEGLGWRWHTILPWSVNFERGGGVIA